MITVNKNKRINDNKKTCKVIHMEIKLSFVIFCDVILRKSGHIRGAKRPSLSEVPYREAFENMNEAVHINKASMFFGHSSKD